MSVPAEVEATPPARPPWPARVPFYYGWVNVVVAAVAMSATLPGRTYGLGLIKEPLRADLGLADERFAWLNFWAIIIGSAVVIPAGRLIDRFGTRVVAVGVSLALGASVLAMSRAADEAALAVMLMLVRGLGQGALSVVAIALVGKWFRRRAGVAMGVFTVLLGVGFVAPPFVLKPMIATDGWRPAWAAVGWALIGFAAFAGLIARSTPEACGVRPDDPAPDADRSAHGMTLGRTLLTPAFWVYTAAGTLLNLVFSAVTLDNELLLRERGLAESRAEETILAALFLAGLPANLLAGWLARRVALRRLLAVGSVLLAATVCTFPFVRSVSAAAGYAALLGASGGVITVVYFAIYGRTFGRAHLGAIQAAAQVCSVFASATGPLILANVRAAGGGTAPFFFGCAAVAAVLGVLCWVVRPPVKGA
jgi:MFS family permease